MPDLILLTSAEGALLLNKHIDKVGTLLRKATVDTFSDLDKDPKTVSVFVLAHQGGDNVPLIQIIGIANWSFKRWLKLKKWKDLLAIAWNDAVVATSIGCDQKDRLPIDKVHVWPIMPFGTWGLVSTIVSNIK